jgi:outer membrane immunogenic protein
MKRTLFAGAVALTVASPAFAADLPAGPPPQAPAAYVPVQAPVYNWGGVYIGLNAGGSWMSQGNGSSTCVGVACVTGTSTGQSFSNSGFTGGGQIGANFQSGQFVFGVEADAEYLSNQSAVATATDFSGIAGSSTTHTFSTDFLSTVRGRLGFAWDRTLLYGTGGLAMADYQVQRTQNGLGLAAASATQTVSNFRIGWAAGAGVEYAFTDNISGRVEYLVAGLESASDNYSFAGATVTTNSPTEYINIVRGGLNFKFGGF